MLSPMDRARGDSALSAGNLVRPIAVAAQVRSLERSRKMPIERETIVTRGGIGAGGIIAAILGAVVVVLLAVWLMSGGLNVTRNGDGGATVDVDVPAVNVTPDGQ
jgi:hypothetical protein